MANKIRTKQILIRVNKEDFEKWMNYKSSFKNSYIAFMKAISDSTQYESDSTNNVSDSTQYESDSTNNVSDSTQYESDSTNNVSDSTQYESDSTNNVSDSTNVHFGFEINCRDTIDQKIIDILKVTPFLNFTAWAKANRKKYAIDKGFYLKTIRTFKEDDNFEVIIDEEKNYIIKKRAK